MEDMKLSLDRENILEFSVDIQGYANTSTSKEPQVRLFLEQKNIGFCMPAKKDNKTYSVIIPEMKNLMESGSCDARMEVIIDNKPCGRGKKFENFKESLDMLIEHFDIK